MDIDVKFLRAQWYGPQQPPNSVPSISKEILALVYIAFAFIQLEVPITEKLTDFPRAP